MMIMGMFGAPKEVMIGAVSAEGKTPLNAFDNCLIRLGVGDVSLVRLTSILPPDVKVVENPPKFYPGSTVPAIYNYIVSTVPGERIAAAIIMGRTEGGPTLVAEVAGRNMTKEEAENSVRDMLEEMARMRGLKLKEILIKSTEHVVERCGCSIAIVVQIR